MKKYKILIDSLSSMPIDVAKQLDIEKLPYYVTDENNNQITDDFSEQQVDLITTNIANKKKYKTGFLPPIIIENKIKEYLNEYQYVIYIASSSGYTGQYEQTKYLQEQNIERVFIINSKSICTINEEMAYAIVDHFKKHNEINQETIDKIIDELNNNSCLLLVPKNVDGLMNSGRIPATLIKLLKIAKVAPIIKVEDKMKPYKLTKSNIIDVHKIFLALDDIFKNKLKPEVIKKIYIVNTLIPKEKIKEIIENVINYYKIEVKNIFVRANPLPIAIYTLKDSIGIGVFTTIKKLAK